MKFNSIICFEVTFDVEERKLLGANMKTEVGRNEGNLTTGGVLKNIFGRGEELNALYTYGTKRNSTFTSTYIKPLHNDIDAR